MVDINDTWSAGRNMPFRWWCKMEIHLPAYLKAIRKSGHWQFLRRHCGRLGTAPAPAPAVSRTNGRRNKRFRSSSNCIHVSSAG